MDQELQSAEFTRGKSRQRPGAVYEEDSPAMRYARAAVIFASR
jgi:hypothetical protein